MVPSGARYMSPYAVIRPQWVNSLKSRDTYICQCMRSPCIQDIPGAWLEPRHSLTLTCFCSMKHKYSLLMHRIKIKSPANVFMEWIKRFCGWIYHFSISLTLVVLQRQKKPTGYWRYYHLRCCRPPWLKCHWSVFPRAQLTITQYWFRQWLGAE